MKPTSSSKRRIGDGRLADQVDSSAAIKRCLSAPEDYPEHPAEVRIESGACAGHAQDEGGFGSIRVAVNPSFDVERDSDVESLDPRAKSYV